ncbi:MAG: hypothetical protein K2H13_02885 [Eubacterium sp.]|nr:hypothetical protein [Eubacterium sp.]MDE6155918.1 hypothetical protein [Eubacterium sp.]MDE6471386.1 hypothetical protein [Eubacterium sp.]MDE6766816.1 hypothetical protein [Eubacterium sp.]
MKFFNNVKLVSSFREISNVLDIVSGAIRIFAFVLMLLQAILLIKETKNDIASNK